MAQTDEEVKRMAEEVEARRKQTEIVKPSMEIPITVKIIIVWLVTYLLLFTNIFPWSQTVKLLILMVVIFVVFMIAPGISQAGEIPEEKIAAIAYQRLLFYQTHRFGDTTRLPKGRIKLNPVGIPQYESWDGDKIKWWNHSFTIQSQVGSEVFKGIIRTHPMTGLMRGILKLEGDITGMEEPNLKFVGKEDLAKTKWARDQLNKFPPYEEFI